MKIPTQHKMLNTAFLIFLMTSLISQAAWSKNVKVSSWSCTAETGLLGTSETAVKVTKDSKGYSIFLTDSAGDVGPDWALKNELVAEGVDCKFSSTLSAPLYCESLNGADWISLSAANLRVASVDQESGKDRTANYTSITLSGTSTALKHYEHSILKFEATNCSRQ